MCGITGILYLHGTRVERKLLERMTALLKHRGPDGEGFYINDNIGFGHRRLNIIDLSKNGRQPMSNEDGSIWITYNGEIYNFQDLSVELKAKGHSKDSAWAICTKSVMGKKNADNRKSRSS